MRGICSTVIASVLLSACEDSREATARRQVQQVRQDLRTIAAALERYGLAPPSPEAVTWSGDPGGITLPPPEYHLQLSPEATASPEHPPLVFYAVHDPRTPIPAEDLPLSPEITGAPDPRLEMRVDEEPISTE